MRVRRRQYVRERDAGVGVERKAVVAKAGERRRCRGGEGKGFEVAARVGAGRRCSPCVAYSGGGRCRDLGCERHAFSLVFSRTTSARGGVPPLPGTRIGAPTRALPESRCKPSERVGFPPSPACRAGQRGDQGERTGHSRLRAATTRSQQCIRYRQFSVGVRCRTDTNLVPLP
jgi:hypothetical protein